MYKSLIISSINLQPLSGNLFPSLKEEKKKEKLKGSLYRKRFCTVKDRWRSVHWHAEAVVSWQVGCCLRSVTHAAERTTSTRPVQIHWKENADCYVQRREPPPPTHLHCKEQQKSVFFFWKSQYFIHWKFIPINSPLYWQMQQSSLGTF